ncbi:diguanylate cyclase (GGDEF) domain-containing protein [Klenkia marina]|uniref:Diguanylate cyclase (GGDEF) domain-containing protein n=1 Tax=Klenkia marina TaxID=1960309 RepID=A0A1G4XXM5_9ACTN|nr:GGDEF domain-containing protein [Klenkia marina]SCX45934.1 diguanylate cyclase (GGDEF) domain-containing protein [Klenkia marina]
MTTAGPGTTQVSDPAPPSALRSVVRFVVAGTVGSVVVTHLVYWAFGLTFDALPVKLVAHGAPVLMPLLIAPLTAIPWVRLQKRLTEANARLAEEVDRRTLLQGELERQARTDPLTEVLNRRGFFELAERSSTTGAVLVLLDLDDFKAVNDTFGHAAGDLVLQAVVTVAQELTETAGGVVGRLGGDEFVVLLPPTTEAVAHRLRDRMTGLDVPLPDEDGVTTSASVGILTMRAGQTVDEALAEVDGGMYERKRAVRSL